MIKYLIYSLTIILGVYLVFLAFMFFYQRSFMYYPSVNNYNDTEINFDYETVSITTPDNINLKAWYSFNQNKKQTIGRKTFFLILLPYLFFFSFFSSSSSSLIPLLVLFFIVVSFSSSLSP